MNERESELRKLFDGADDACKACADRLIGEMCFLEERLTDLRQKPFLSVNPKNPAQQRQTPAAKQYRELLQQYTNIVKIMMKMTGSAETEEESPLRSFMKTLNAGDA